MVIGGYRWLWVVIRGYRCMVIDGLGGYSWLLVVIDAWLYTCMVIDGYTWL